MSTKLKTGKEKVENTNTSTKVNTSKDKKESVKLYTSKYKPTSKTERVVLCTAKGAKGIYKGAQATRRVVQTGKDLVSEDPVKQTEAVVKTATKPARLGGKLGLFSIRKYVDHKIRKTEGSTKQEKWSNRKRKLEKVGKIQGKIKTLSNKFNKVKKFSKSVTTENDFENTVNYVKGVTNFTTKPVQKVAKKTAKKALMKVGRVVAKVIGSAIQAVMAVLKGILAFAGPLILILMLVLIVVLSFSSVFGGISLEGSKTHEEIQNTVSDIEDVFSELQERKDNEYEKFSALVESKVKNSQKPSKSEFAGISDEEYDELLKTQWHDNTFVESSVSYIDYTGLAVISQYRLKNNTDKLKDLINKLDEKGLIEEYTENVIPIEYEVKWTEWKPTKSVTGKTKEEVIKKAGNEKMLSEPAKDKNGKWSVQVGEGIERTKKLTYQQYSVFIENGSYEQFLEEAPSADKTMDELEKKRELGFMKYSYGNEHFMDSFSKEWNKSFGTSVAGGEYVGGVKNGNLYNWKGSPKDFSGNGYSADLIGQCTWFAEGRWAKTHKGQSFNAGGNAGEWFASASQNGMSVGRAPRPHAVIVLSGGTGQYAGCGHVAFIEEIEMKNGEITSITISQGNVGGVSQAEVMVRPMQSTDVRKYKNMEEYLAMWGAGLQLQGYIY